MQPEKKEQKRFYLKWPWDLMVYALLVVLLRVFSIPVILLLVRWNKKQQPDGPAESYCLQRARRQLILLVWAAAALLMAAAGAAYLTLSWKADKTGWDFMEYIKLAAAGLLAVGGVLAAGYLIYTGLRDAFCPEKSRLAQSIRDQLTYPEEAPPAKELFAMVDEDLRRNGRWFGRLAVGSEWILGDEVLYIPRIRGVFWRDEIRTRRSGNRVTTARILQLWFLDDRQQCQPTDLRSPKEMQAALDCLHQRVPAAVFAKYDSREYNDCIHADEQQWYFMEQEFERRKARLEQDELVKEGGFAE